MVKIHIDEMLDGFYLMRIDDDETKYFEALWPIPQGITYNAYLWIGGKGAILFDGWKEKYSEQFISSIREIIDPRKITHIIIHHVEPDHTGTLSKLLSIQEINPNLLIHQIGKRILESLYNVKARMKTVRDGEELIIADMKLRFIHTPWLHWPETMMTYVPDKSILFSGDAFGGYSTPPKLYDEDHEMILNYLEEVKKYVATIIGNYRSHIVKNIEKLMAQEIPVKIIAPLHGLVWKKNPKFIINYYMKLAKGVPEKKILIIYGSMYGACRRAIEVAERELSSKGYESITYGFTDISQPSLTNIIGEAIESKAIIIAAPTYEGNIFPKIRHLIEIMKTKTPAKPILIISSYGWAGIAGKKIRDLMAEKGYEIIDVIEFRGRVDEGVSEKIKRGVAELIERIEDHEY